MEIFPAIDLKDGRVVRLTQGDFGKVAVYNPEPALVLDAFAQAGARWVHVVDLDGARNGSMQQDSLIGSWAKNASLKLQVGGGIRRAEQIEKLLKAGVARVVVGSVAVEQPDVVKQWLKIFGGDKLALAFDVRLGANGEAEVLLRGWQEESHQNLWSVLEQYKNSGLKTILCTDVTRDGMLTGANLSLYRILKERAPWLQVMASGGVRDEKDFVDLSALGLYGALVGKAYYEGRIDLKKVLALYQG